MVIFSLFKWELYRSNSSCERARTNACQKSNDVTKLIPSPQSSGVLCIIFSEISSSSSSSCLVLFSTLSVKKFIHEIKFFSLWHATNTSESSRNCVKSLRSIFSLLMEQRKNRKGGEACASIGHCTVYVVHTFTGVCNFIHKNLLLAFCRTLVVFQCLRRLEVNWREFFWRKKKKLFKRKASSSQVKWRRNKNNSTWIYYLT